MTALDITAIVTRFRRAIIPDRIVSERAARAQRHQPRAARMGMAYTRWPVASNTAAAMAGAMAMMGVSPAPEVHRRKSHGNATCHNPGWKGQCRRHRQ
jgi:hypothetical protein